MYIVFCLFSEEGEIVVTYRKGGIGTAIGYALAWQKLSGSTLKKVRCLGQNLDYEKAREVFKLFSSDISEIDGRCIWEQGYILDHRTDRKNRGVNYVKTH